MGIFEMDTNYNSLAHYTGLKAIMERQFSIVLLKVAGVVSTVMTITSSSFAPIVSVVTVLTTAAVCKSYDPLKQLSRLGPYHLTLFCVVCSLATLLCF